MADYTVRIFDNFYNLDLVVNASEYEIVYSYFESYTSTPAVAKTFTQTLFKISNVTQVPVLELLKTFQTGSNPDLSRIMTYYLNSLSNKFVLYGINDVMAPNNLVARNIIEVSDIQPNT